ncbi:MAG: T9SS type A sorting domain-containing protein [Bacteroidales bacterium]|jgi:hypothetical protein|nr:T9SS type A sorting domain-containing protein [Bacteroidales bacterium]
MKKIVITSLFLLSVVCLCAQEKVKVLYVGNSYTYVNDLPTIISNIAASQNHNIVSTQFLTGGAMFQTHYNNQALIDTIKKGGFDIMVLQGQSQEVCFPPYQFQSQVYPYAKKLDSIFKAYNHNGKVIFYMTWGYRYGDAINCQEYAPFCNYFSMSEEICNNYTTMANDFSSFVAPVGKAWQKSIIEDSNIVLHQSDNSHPTIKGSYLAACVFYNTMFNDTVSSTFYSTLNQNDAQRMQRIANYITRNNASLPCNLNQTSSLNEMLQEDETTIWYERQNNMLNITINKVYEPTTAIIYDINGKQMMKEKILPNNNSIHTSIDVKKLKQGTYIIKVYSNNSFKTTKFIKY